MAYPDEFVNVFFQEEQPQDDGLESRMKTEWNGTAENERLDIFDRSGAGLETFPALPQNLGHICKLDLSNNDLQSIPEAVVARMLNLVVLDVRSNQLRSLPGSVGCLSKLKTLNASGNLMESLPQTIKNCRSLEELNVNFNKLNQLPENIGSELQNLKKLSANSNKLSFLPESITNLINLRVLDARLNCIQALPEDLENLINLQVLNVSQNFHYLKRLPYSVGLLLSLTELDVSYNKITVLPNSIGCLKKLQKLSIEGNPLISPPMEVAEQSLYAVKVYLADKMNSAEAEEKSIPHKKKSWIGKLVKYTGLKGHNRRREEHKLPKEHEDMSEGYIMLNYLTFDSAAQKTFSPRGLANNSPFFGLVSTGKSIHS